MPNCTAVVAERKSSQRRRWAISVLSPSIISFLVRLACSRCRAYNRASCVTSRTFLPSLTGTRVFRHYFVPITME